MMRINKAKILFVLSVTLCSALVAESLFGLGKTSLQKFESWLEQQKVDSYEDIYAKASQYVQSRELSGGNTFVDTRLVRLWGELDESKKSGNCFKETLDAIYIIKDDLKENKLEGILGKTLNPLLKEVEEICNSKVSIYRKGQKVNPLTQANNLLLESTKSDDIIDNIAVAKELLAKNQNDEVQQLLKDFVGLQPIFEQNQEGKLVCSEENMNLIKTIENTMKKIGSIYWPTIAFGTDRRGRVEKIIVALSEQVGKVCLEPLVEQFNNLQPKLDYDRTRALKQLSNEDDVVFFKPAMLVERARKEKPINLSPNAALDWADRFVRMNVALYGEKKLCKWDPLEREHYAPIEFVQEKYDDLVVKTCKHFEREDLIPILEETLRIARSVRLYPGSAPGAFVKNGLADVASNWVVCKRLEGVDQSKLIANIAATLPMAERDFPHKFAEKISRSELESGC